MATAAIESPQGDPARLFHTRPAIEVLGGYEFRAGPAFTVSITRDRLPRGVEVGETRTVLQDVCFLVSGVLLCWIAYRGTPSQASRSH